MADALRCIDYLYTRSDVDPGSGVAMTGVSGGGTTTLMAGLLGGIVAAHLAAIDRQMGAVVLWDCLRSFEDLLQSGDCA